MKFKDSTVSVSGVHPKIVPVLFQIDQWLRPKLGYEMILTSVCDGIHSTRSEHYRGTAFDFRTWTDETSGVQIPADQKHKLAKELAAFLGDDWFVLAESTHIHVAWRPMRVV